MSIDKVGERIPPDKIIESFYECPSCHYKWTGLWDSACDDMCPRCGLKNISPKEWKEHDG